MVRVTNLILNPLGDSSTDITGYSAANDATVAFASGGGVLVTAQVDGIASSGVEFRSALGSLVVGQEYTVSLDVVGEVESTWRISVQGGLAESVINTSSVLVPVGETRRLSVTFTAAIATGGDIYVSRISSSVASQAVVRKVMCSTITGPYFDGDSGPMRYGPTAQLVIPTWSGTPGNSTSYFDYEEPWTPNLIWDSQGERSFELGVDRGVFYPKSGDGVPWNGLISVKEKINNADPTMYYIDGLRYYVDLPVFEYGATIEAFTYPDEFLEYSGFMEYRPGMYYDEQPIDTFGFSYRTKIGDGSYGSDIFYKIHLVYNAMAIPSERSYETINDSPGTSIFSWEIVTLPASNLSEALDTAHIVIDSRKVTGPQLKTLEDLLYGDGVNPPELPSPDEVQAIFE